MWWTATRSPAIASAWRRLGAAVLLAVLLSSPAGGSANQTPSPMGQAPAGLIVGAVTDGDSASPIAGVQVRVTGGPPPAPGRPAPSETVMTGSDGRFMFRDLPKGSFSISAQKPGYLPGAYGRRAPASIGGQSITLAEGQRVADAAIRMWKYASLSGTVFDEAGEPVVGTTVKACLRTVLAGRVKLDFQATSAAAYTDDRGVYRHDTLAPGDYVVVVASVAATMPVSLQETYYQQVRDRAVTNLQREINASSAMLPTLAGLRVGDFVVSYGRAAIGNTGVSRRAGPGALPLTANGELQAYQTQFYSGSTVPAAATVVTLRSGEERAGIDFQLRPITTQRVSGTVMGPDGPQPFLGLQLHPEGIGEFTSDAALLKTTTVTDAHGEFTFLGVAPGQYVLHALRKPLPPRAGAAQNPPAQGTAPPPPSIPSDPTLWAAVPIAVGEQPLNNVRVTLRTGLRVTGRLEFDGATQKPASDRIARIGVEIEPSDGRGAGLFGVLGVRTPILGRPDAAGQIATYGLPAGKYMIALSNAPAGWTLKSAMVNGRDVSVAPLELTDADVEGLVVTLSDHPTRLSGMVRDTDGRADHATDVVIFPIQPGARLDAGANPRRVRAVRTARDGAYAFIGLPPGDYFIVALPDEAMTNWSEAKFLAALAPKAARVHVDESGSGRQDLQTVRIK